jgi:WD40 repeat protein
VPSKRQLKTQLLTGHGHIVTKLLWCADELLCSASADHTLRVWTGGRSLLHLKGHRGSVTALCEWRRGIIASGSRDYSLRLWSVECAQPLHVVDGAHRGTIYDIVALDERTLVTAGADHTVRWWTAASSSSSPFSSSSSSLSMSRVHVTKHNASVMRLFVVDKRRRLMAVHKDLAVEWIDLTS